MATHYTNEGVELLFGSVEAWVKANDHEADLAALHVRLAEVEGERDRLKEQIVQEVVDGVDWAAVSNVRDLTAERDRYRAIVAGMPCTSPEWAMSADSKGCGTCDTCLARAAKEGA